MNRPSQIIRPVTVSQHSSQLVLGLDGPRFLDLLRLHPEVPRVKSGRTVLVRIEEIERLLLRLEAEGEPLPMPEKELNTADEVLALVGEVRKRA